MTEQILTWGKVVESDEIYSARTNKWYTVRQMSLSADGKTVHLYREGFPGKSIVPVDGEVRVRRGKTGQCVDMFQVIFSGPTSPESVGITAPVLVSDPESEDE